MKAFILLFFIGIAVFFGASAFPVRDIVEKEQIQKPASEIHMSVLDKEDLERQKEDSKKLETKEEVVVIEEGPPPAPVDLPAQTGEMVVKEIPEVVPVFPHIEQPAVVEENEPKISFSEINTSTREALVNIFCTTKSGGSFKPITGSGIIIDERGIILTNAHVAQYFLLKNYLTENFIECTIRSGSPAQPKYKAIPIFISPSWIKENANGIIQQVPKGTGEDDYALLLITERTNLQEGIPKSFSFISPEYNSGKIKVGDRILLAAYPAGFLGGISIQKGLYISSTVTEIMELFTFREGTLDLFSIGGSVVAQQGSSGGAVVGDEGKLLGIIVTSSIADTTQERDLRAITIAHINRSFVKDTGFDLQTLFSSDIVAEADAFNENIAPALKQLLEDELKKK